MGYACTIIQVVCWVELLEQGDSFHFFLKYGSQLMGHNSVVSGHPKSTGIPQVDGLSTGPPDLGCHSDGAKFEGLVTEFEG